MLVSVVIPVYNGEAYLAEAIESVLSQTHSDFELIVVDDGSTDRSAEITKAYLERDNRVRMIRQPNKGVSIARNMGLRWAQADWVACLDADDVMFPHRLERQLAFIEEHPDVRCFSAIAQYINAKGKPCGHTVPVPIATREQLDAYLATGRLIGLNHPSVMMHSETVLNAGGYHPEIRNAEDLDLWMRLAQAGYLVLQQYEVLTKYRIHPTSIVATWAYESHHAGDWVEARAEARRQGNPEPSLEQFEMEWRKQPFWARADARRQILAWVYYRRAGCALCNEQWFKGVRNLVFAGCLRPLYVASRLVQQLKPNRTGVGNNADPGGP